MTHNTRGLTKFDLHPALLAKLERFATDHPDEIISVWGINLRCFYASPSTISIPGGYTADEIIGHKAAEFVHLSDLAHVALAKSDVELTGKSVEMSVDVRNKFNERVRVRSQTIRITEPTTGRLFFLTRSVTPDKKLSSLDSF
jgi:hypothetical protein